MNVVTFLQTLSPAPGTDARTTYEAFLQVAADEPHIIGVVLFGSQSREGMPTVWSDYDVYVIVDDEAPDTLLTYADGFHSSHLDAVFMRLADFRAYALPGHPAWWDAYAFVGAKVALDRAGGLIAELVAAKTVLDASAARRRALRFLDAYTNSAYRSLKNHRDGRRTAAVLDAAESISTLLPTLFALHGRIRPFNKYLQWELERRPLHGAQWAADVLLERLDRIRLTADPDTQSEMFRGVESLARAAGLGATLDDWGDELRLLRGAGRRGSED